MGVFVEFATETGAPYHLFWSSRSYKGVPSLFQIGMTFEGELLSKKYHPMLGDHFLVRSLRPGFIHLTRTELTTSVAFTNPLAWEDMRPTRYSGMFFPPTLLTPAVYCIHQSRISGRRRGWIWNGALHREQNFAIVCIWILASAEASWSYWRRCPNDTHVDKLIS